MNAAGGVTLIFKYTGKSPIVSSQNPRPMTPSLQGFGSLRPRTLGARSPLSSSARLLQQSGGVEALLQGAAKGVLERGEKLGINQAVRDAMGEIRRNVQGLQEAQRASGRTSARSFGNGRSSSSDPSVAVTLVERRNRQLAAMLDESIENLKLLAASWRKGEEEQNRETIEVAAAKIQFVKTCLEDSSIPLVEADLPALKSLSISSPTDTRAPTVALDTTPVVMTSSAVQETRSALSSPGPSDDNKGAGAMSHSVESLSTTGKAIVEDGDKMDTDTLGDNEQLETNVKHTAETLAVPTDVVMSPTTSTPTFPEEIDPLAASSTNTDAPPPPPKEQKQQRPQGPIPTRSTIAHSSFAWMLEPDTTASSALHGSSSSSTAASRSMSSPHSSSPFSSSSRPSSKDGKNAPSKRRINNASRERNAFLFGEIDDSFEGGTDGNTASGGGKKKSSLLTEEIFGLQPIRKGGTTGTGTGPAEDT